MVRGHPNIHARETNSPIVHTSQYKLALVTYFLSWCKSPSSAFGELTIMPRHGAYFLKIKSVQELGYRSRPFVAESYDGALGGNTRFGLVLM